MFFSVIVPLYNRPFEIQELLESLLLQDYTNFEVLIIEDGSSIPAGDIVRDFADRLKIRYYVKENGGQGMARNFAFERAKGDFFIIFDSDCLIPPSYLSEVRRGLQEQGLDAYGGPDAAHSSFTPIQKAISYAMTSPFTTGGIRGNKRHLGPFHPRSFNMGISRKVWEQTGGFRLTRLGEDIEFSIRISRAGFKVGLLPRAFVYHKRRTNFLQFYKQLHFFGRARINIYKHFSSELKLVHFFPAAFVAFLAVLALINLFGSSLAPPGNMLLLLYAILILMHAFWTSRSLPISLLALLASLIQLTAYGLGFIQDFTKEVLIMKIIKN